MAKSKARARRRQAGWSRRRSRVALGLASLLVLLATPGEAWSCRLALVLAIDVSKSVDSREYRQQLQGLAQALRDGRSGRV